MIEAKALYWCGIIIGLLVMLAVFPPLALMAGGAGAVVHLQRRRARRRPPPAPPGWTPEQINRTYFS